MIYDITPANNKLFGVDVWFEESPDYGIWLAWFATVEEAVAFIDSGKADRAYRASIHYAA